MSPAIYELDRRGENTNALHVTCDVMQGTGGYSYCRSTAVFSDRPATMSCAPFGRAWPWHRLQEFQALRWPFAVCAPRAWEKWVQGLLLGWHRPPCCLRPILGPRQRTWTGLPVALPYAASQPTFSSVPSSVLRRPWPALTEVLSLPQAPDLDWPARLPGRSWQALRRFRAWHRRSLPWRELGGLMSSCALPHP